MFFRYRLNQTVACRATSSSVPGSLNRWVTAESGCQLPGILKSDDSFRALSSGGWPAHPDPMLK